MMTEDREQRAEDRKSGILPDSADSASSLSSPAWFFKDPEAVAKLLATRDEWRGTPFAPFSCARGPHGGIDCVGYVEALMAGAGLPKLNFPRDPSDYSRHVHNDKILNFLRGLHPDDPQSAQLKAIFAEFEVRECDFTEPPMVGDLLILKDAGRLGRVNGVFHMPVMTGPRKFTHCAPRLGVSEGNIEDPTYREHLVAHFRARALA